jgi:hypothetical protein
MEASFCCSKKEKEKTNDSIQHWEPTYFEPLSQEKIVPTSPRLTALKTKNNNNKK